MQNRDRKRSNQQNARTRVYVTMSCSHNRLAVREEEESFSVTQHVSDLSLFLRGERPLKHLGPLALQPPTFQTFVSLPRDSMLVAVASLSLVSSSVLFYCWRISVWHFWTYLYVYMSTIYRGKNVVRPHEIES